MLTVFDRLDAVDKHVMNTLCVSIDSRLVGRQILPHVDFSCPDGVRVENDEVRVPPGPQ